MSASEHSTETFAAFEGMNGKKRAWIRTYFHPACQVLLHFKNAHIAFHYGHAQEPVC